MFTSYYAIYSRDGKAEFSASLLQSSVSHDPSEIILIYWCIAQVIFLIIINAEDNVVLLHIFLWNLESDTFLFRIL